MNVYTYVPMLMVGCVHIFPLVQLYTNHQGLLPATLYVHIPARHIKAWHILLVYERREGYGNSAAQSLWRWYFRSVSRGFATIPMDAVLSESSTKLTTGASDLSQSLVFQTINRPTNQSVNSPINWPINQLTDNQSTNQLNDQSTN